MLVDSLTKTPEALPSLQPQQKTLLHKLDLWSNSLFHLLPPLCGLHASAASTLLMYHGLSHVWLSACLDGHQRAYDSYTPWFASIIQHALDVIRNDLTSIRFWLEIGVIQPLYFVASKCRDPILRSQATALIRTGAVFRITYASPSPG